MQPHIYALLKLVCFFVFDAFSLSDADYWCQCQASCLPSLNTGLPQSAGFWCQSTSLNTFKMLLPILCSRHIRLIKSTPGLGLLISMAVYHRPCHLQTEIFCCPASITVLLTFYQPHSPDSIQFICPHVCQFLCLKYSLILQVLSWTSFKWQAKNSSLSNDFLQLCSILNIYRINA